MTASSSNAVVSAARTYRAALALVGGWVLASLPWEGPHWESSLENFLIRVFAGFPALADWAVRATWELYDVGFVTFGVSIFAMTLLVPLGFLARMVARARIRAGHADPLDRVRAWTAAHPRATTALMALLPAALHVLRLADSDGRLWTWSPWTVAALSAIGIWIQTRLALGGLRALLDPTTETQDQSAGVVAIDPDEMRFDAVAVTTETRAAVGVVAGMTLGVIAWVATRPVVALFQDPHILATVAGYVAAASAAAWFFRRASRIAVGRDGVYVGGTSRPRFFAFRDLDEVRERHGDLELARRGSTRLRLQLHGRDALRRAAILARIRDGIAQADRVQHDGAAHFVASVSSSTVARSAQGGTDYRVPSISRDALWSLVEGAGVDGAARAAAARALVEDGDRAEMRRVRVAASRCADPDVRSALEEIAAPPIEDDADGEGPPPREAPARGQRA